MCVVSCPSSVHFHRIVPNLEDDESPTSKSDASDGNEVNDITSTVNASIQSPKFIQNAGSKALGSLKSLQSTNPEDDEIGDGLRTTTTATTTATTASNSASDTIDLSQTNLSDRIHQHPFTSGKVERRRRKLPEIPKNKKCTLLNVCYVSLETFSFLAYYQQSLRTIPILTAWL